MNLPFDYEGKTFDFYGVDGNCFCLDGKAYEVVEDENDGYPSACKEVIERSPDGLNLFKTPIAQVRIEDRDRLDGDQYKDADALALIDAANGHEWLVFGTDDYNDYYPMFVFQYMPREPVTGP